jgi:hypothetical protein
MNGPVRTYDWPSLMVDEWTATRGHYAPGHVHIDLAPRTGNPWIQHDLGRHRHRKSALSPQLIFKPTSCRAQQ